jgi:hypothetical protein
VDLDGGTSGQERPAARVASSGEGLPSPPVTLLGWRRRLSEVDSALD